jgi:hypothetical protein
VREYQKIVEPPLPHMMRLHGFVRQRRFPAFGNQSTQFPGKTLPDCLHYARQIASLRFTEQEMYVFGHNHKTDDHAAILPPHLLKNLQEKIAPSSAVEQGPSVVAAGGDEVQVPGAITNDAVPSSWTRVLQIRRTLVCDE